MNEKILQALMKLFAIITDVREEHLSGNARELVRDYLSRQFSKELVTKYINYFDYYLHYYHKDSLNANSEKLRKQTALNSVKIFKICEEIKEELQLEARTLTVVELLEFIKKENVVTDHELQFINIVAEYLELDKEEYRNIRSFAIGPYTEVPDKDKLLIINNDQDFDHPEIKHAYRRGLNGSIILLYIPSTSTLIFQYLGKQNLYLNGHNIRVKRIYVLSPGSVIRSSRVQPVYFSRILRRFIQAKAEDKIVYKARDIAYKFPNGNYGLHSFSLQSESGYLIGIMGSSGTGKSTLMNVLNGNLPLHQGKITINGYDIHREKGALNGLVGFVPQDDLLIEDFTVYQNMYYNARLCFSDFDESQIHQRIEEALVNFDLVEARDLQVGNKLASQISGGQRKRLNIALELIREPVVLFVDEPTSGLSSMDTEKVMLLLKRQTLKSKLVVVNIHQPSSDMYKLLDRVLIMDQGGRVVYNGNPSDAIIYFNSKGNYVNPQESECPLCGNIKTEQPLRIIEARIVDRYGKLIRKRKVSPQEWYETYREVQEPRRKPSHIDEKIRLPENNFKIPDKFRQFGIFLQRNFHAKVVNKQYLMITLLEAPVLALILAYFSKFIRTSAESSQLYQLVDNKNIPAFFFMSVIVALFLGLVVSAEEIIKDRKILKRESFLNLSRASYINAKVIGLLIMSAIQTFLYTWVAGSILDINFMLWENWLILFSLAFSANVLGLNISSAIDTVVNVYILIPFVLVPQLLLSGVVINFNDLHPNLSHTQYVPVTGDVMASRWGFEAMMVNQYKNNRYRKPFFDEEVSIYTSIYEAAYRIPELERRIKDIKAGRMEKAKIPRNLRLIRNEIKKIQNAHFVEIEPFSKISKLDTAGFSQEIAREAVAYLVRVKKLYQQTEKQARLAKDKIVKKRLSSYGQSGYLQLKNAYTNDAVETYVRDKMHLNKTYEDRFQLIRRKDPIYMLPEHPFGRAHFYAPYKKLGPYYINTLVFNMLFVWLGTLVFYIALQMDLLRKIVQKVEQIYLRYSKMIVHRRL